MSGTPVHNAVSLYYQGFTAFLIQRYATLLTILKDDREKFVKISVGNNLNDLYKEAPDKAEYIIAQWRKTSQGKEQEWIIKHGLRNQKQMEII